jgi:hypothetical protein
MHRDLWNVPRAKVQVGTYSLVGAIENTNKDGFEEKKTTQKTDM